MKQEVNRKPSPVATATEEADNLDERAVARAYEQSGDNKKAIAAYETLIKRFPREAVLYDRLMILYRKEKAYKKELAVIDKAISEFNDLLLPDKKSASRKIASLSKSILQSIGLTDRKGAALYHPQPIARWQKRKNTLKKRAGRS